jgi:antagonist of KipI
MSLIQYQKVGERMPHLFVREGGLQTTVQDLGRPGFAHLGISASGAADTLALRVGNLLIGNPQGAAALEMTLTGGTFEFDQSAICAITGSDFDPRLDGESAPMWSSFEVRAGQTLSIGATRSGARCYLSVRGGIDVKPVFGSASTHLQTGLGGFKERALRKGDVVQIGESSDHNFTPLTLADPLRNAVEPSKVLRITVGPQRGLFRNDSWDSFLESSYEVKEETNRMGIRLAGRSLDRQQAGDIITEGVPLGAVQIPPNGQPIILFVEHQTTGGYPKIANVISADFHSLGQLRPRDVIRFELMTFEQANAVRNKLESLINSFSLITL